MIVLNKTKFIVIIIIVLFLVSLLTYLNYDKIFNYFTNRQWEIADSVGKVELENYINTFGTNSEFFIVNTGMVQGYSETSKKIFEKTISLKDVISSTAGDYAIIAEKNSTDIYTFNKNEDAWNTTINNANILGITINKNGYSAVIYSQAGYKSLVKVFSNAGEELFTSYLASTYAVDVAISNDNKTLAIAEIDTNGVSVASDIKLIDVLSASESKVKKIDMENDELISNIEYDDENHLVIMTDKNIKYLKNDKINSIINFKEEKILHANISNGKNIVATKVEEKGLFNMKCYICIYDLNNGSNVKTYEIEETPNNIVVCKDIIAIDTGNKIIFLNCNRKFCEKV